MRIKTILTLLSVILSLTHCMSYDFSMRKVQQGTLLSPARIAHLHLGMSKADVAILMGTSLISPMFQMDRWDYAYTIRHGNNPNAVRHLSVYFKDDRVVNIDKKL